MIFSRIRLEDTNYSPSTTWAYLNLIDAKKLNDIYTTYCQHKKFVSVKPIFESEYLDPSNDIIGYWDNTELVAFSIIHRFDYENAECVQFAWNYKNPKLRLGIESLKTECAIYKKRGFKYLYLGLAHDYKTKFDGYEELGPL
jgi:hypothetical protein